MALIVLQTVALFALDVVTPLGVAVWVMYLLPLGLTVWLPQRRAPFLAAAGYTVLLLLGFFVSPPGLPRSIAFLNRVLGACALWATAWFLYRYTRTAEAGVQAEIRTRRHIEERLRASEDARAILEAAVDSSEDAIISTTLDGIVIGWNRGAERIFDYTADDLIDQPIAPLIPPARLDEALRIIACLKRGESVEHFQTVRRRKDGRAVSVSLSASPIRNAGGQIIGASLVARKLADSPET